MISRLSYSLLLTLFLTVYRFYATGTSVTDVVPDTLTHSVPVILTSDSSGIGPEFVVSESSILIDENELPSFGMVLNQFKVPCEGKVISRYGMRRGRMHMGTDIKLNLGDTVYAAYEGIVKRASRYYGYGNLVILDHSHGLETYYGHLSKILVRPGDTLHAGAVLGLGGRTGRATTEHLHFEIREQGKAYNPELVYDFPNNTIRSEVTGKDALADLIHNPKTGENIHISAHGNRYAMEMTSVPAAEYVIKAGDSLWEIARRFNTSVTELCERNNLTTRSILKIGMVLKIFGSGNP